MTPIIVTHGGAGAPQDYNDGCDAACKAGAVSLESGGIDAALRAVVEAAVSLEEDPRFNAGVGSNLRMDGSVEQDAILATSDGRIGCVACIESTRNPVRVARLVMDSPHVMLCGAGATAFARERGHLWHECRTGERAARHKAAIERLKSGQLRPVEEKWRGRGMGGTIGAVASAADGTFAVSCSTGGTSLMLPGRVGDTPIFGAGVMCGVHGAVCATGEGEEIIRNLCSMRVYERIERGEHPQKAVDAVVAAHPAPYTVGLIAVSNLGYGIAATGGIMASAAWQGK